MSSRVLIAGLAGGTAEILWVLGYGAVAPVSAAEIAREVTASVLPGAAAWTAAPALGVGMHLALSIAVAYAFLAALGRLLPGRHNAGRYVALAVAALAGVWAVNFLLLLPLLNPRFVTLMPYAATLFSKALFGAAMGAVLARTAPRRLVSERRLPAGIMNVPLIHALHEQARRHELERALKLLRRGEAQARVLERLSQGLTNKLMHAPTQALGEIAGDERRAPVDILTVPPPSTTNPWYRSEWCASSESLTPGS